MKVARPFRALPEIERRTDRRKRERTLRASPAGVNAADRDTRRTERGIESAPRWRSGFDVHPADPSV